MQIENHKEEVPFAHYVQRFQNFHPQPEELDRRGIRWNESEFYVNLLGREFAISHPEYAIRALDGGQLPPLVVQTFLLRYLLESEHHPWLGQWKTFREMPWGETYVKAFTGRALSRAAFTFGHKLDAFCAACEKIGGQPVNHGDAGYQLDFIGNYRVQIFVWAGDEEFPPSAQILYSDNFAAGFTAEDRVVAADILISTVKANM